MPSNDLPGLSPVAIEYLRYHDELEAAREAFADERGKLLDALGGRLRAAAVEHGLRVEGTLRDDKAGEFEVSLGGKYVTRRAAGGKKRTAGLSVHVGAFAGHTGAQTTLWFHLRLSGSRRRDLAIDELAKRLGPDVEVLAEGAWLHFRTSTHAATALDLGALEDATTRLPELFAIADDWLAQRWT